MTLEPPDDLAPDPVLDARRQSRAPLDRLYPVVYDELRTMAHRAMRRENSGHTLNTTALVHEAYLKLVKQDGTRWNDRSHFLAVAATAMRRILVDHARRQKRSKRGGDQRPITLNDAMVAVEEEADGLILLDEALDALAALDERMGRVVECRFFAGLSVAETAAALGVTTRTVERDWQKARAWLSLRLGRADD